MADATPGDRAGGPDAFSTWASYFYPPPDDGTLRNLFDERDPRVLDRLEYVESAERQRELLAGEVMIPRTFDAAHVRAIHGHLFQDVYAWAGEYRSVEMVKGVGRGFAEVGSGEIDRYLADVHRLVDGAPWPELGAEEFAERSAEVFAYLNQAHPFREGNGRTSKVFMEHVAELSGFTFDYSRVGPEVWGQASMLSRPDLFAYEPVSDFLVPVFREITETRELETVAEVNEASLARSVYSASYPASAREAARAPGRARGTGQAAERPYRERDGRSRGPRDDRDR